VLDADAGADNDWLCFSQGGSRLTATAFCRKPIDKISIINREIYSAGEQRIRRDRGLFDIDFANNPNMYFS